MDCTSQLVRKLYEKKFTYGRTKTKSIITNVFLPYALNVLKKDLSKCNFVSIMTDASNHNSQKMIPMFTIFYLTKELKIIFWNSMSFREKLHHY